MTLPPITGAEQYVGSDGRLTFDGQKVFGQIRDLVQALEDAGMSLSQFNEQLTARRFPLIELNSAYGLSVIRDVQTVTGSGAISASSTGEILLSTGTTASSTARLDSAERIRYLPGYGAEVGVGIRIPTLPTGNQEAKWGVRNPAGTEGFYWGIDATGAYTAILRNSSETKTYISAANIDRLDGGGTSRLTLDVSDGNIFQIDFTWYGYGQILFDVVDVVGTQQKTVQVQSYKPIGATSVQSPNLPIFIEATNGGDATDFDVYVGGRQASIVGEYNPLFRTTSQSRGSVSTTTTTKPLVSFRNKTGFQDRSVRIDNSAASVSTEDHIVEFYLNGSLTGASWGTPTNATASETSLEADVSATAITGGTLVFSYFAKAGESNKADATAVTKDFNVPENQILSMCARTVTGTGTCDVSYLRMQEEW